ncbi:MAG: FG-GAP repeat domain-containing protein [Vicinamibacterales bacterium]
MNADGLQDVILVNNCGGISGCLAAGAVSVLLGSGNGQLQPAVTYATGGDSPVGLAVADLNGDGHLDVAVANACSASNMCSVGTAGVLIGRGDGTFEPAVSYDSNGFGTRSIAVADVNLDGRFDLVVASLCGVGSCLDGTVAVLLGNGDGTFHFTTNYSSGGDGAESVVVADVNGDGRQDVVVANDACPSTVCGGAAVSVLLNNAPVAVVGIDIEPGRFPNRVAPFSHQSLRVAVLTTDTFDVKRVELGTVRFGPAGAMPNKARLKDIDGDGRLDAVFSFRANRTGIACADTTASLTGATKEGAGFKGTDSIVTIGCRHALRRQ